MTEPITVESHIQAPLHQVWEDFTNPETIKLWNTPAPEWHTTEAENDLRIGGTFSFRMEAKDGSTGFDFAGTYTAVIPEERIEYTMIDGRTVQISFKAEAGGTRVIERFDPETENSPELQRAGWQAILDNFAKYVEQSM